MSNLAAPDRVSRKALSKHLDAIGQEAHTITADGTQVTKEEALARLLWDKALGYTETIRDDNGTQKEIVHKPESWALEYIYERKEGKAPPAIADSSGGIRAADKVRQLAKERLNNMAIVTVATAKTP